VEIELLWFPGCPNWQETDRRLREALALAGADAEVVLVEVSTPDDADRLRFRGSPTVLVDGTDPFADDHAPVGPACTSAAGAPSGRCCGPSAGSPAAAYGSGR
jgi:hypothetical protein